MIAAVSRSRRPAGAAPLARRAVLALAVAVLVPSIASAATRPQGGAQQGAAGADSARPPVVITGQVTTSEGILLPGAGITVTALGLRVVTDEGGRYVLVVPAELATGRKVKLEVRLDGFRDGSAKMRVTAASQIVILTHNFSLEPDLVRVCEALAAQRGGTPAVSLDSTIEPRMVDTATVRNSHEWNLVAALAAKAAGVDVGNTSGSPGSASFMRIRGASSFLGSGQPLFVVDGVPMDNSYQRLGPQGYQTSGTNRIADINPEDIASIEIIKGPAAAFYGARGAQGVVLITTKGGASTRTRNHACIDAYRRLKALGKPTS